MTQKIALILLAILLCNCSNDDAQNPTTTDKPDPDSTSKNYFPPITGTNWETNSLQELDWDTTAEQELYTFLEERDTEAFIILKDGKIVIEKYFNESTISSNHPWFSVGKSLTAFTMGITQQEGFLKLNESSSKYLGTGWSNMNSTQEDAVLIKNHLTMTTGLEYDITNNNCTDPECLTYKNPPGIFWFYHTGAYTLATTIISNATEMDYNDYVRSRISDQIGMDGDYLSLGYAKVFFSTARSMARFGLLVLNEGIWDGTAILNDNNYFEAMTTTSQDQNDAYGYLWWLNGKESFRAPTLESEFPGKLIQSAPDDLIAGLGKDDQKLYVVPSQNIVIVRLGDKGSTQTLLGSSGFDNEIWEKINALIK